MRGFKKRFELALQEDVTAGDGGAFGGGDSFGHAGDLESTDFYAPGDFRLPKSIYGGVLTRKGVTKNRKKKKNGRKKSK